MKEKQCYIMAARAHKRPDDFLQRFRFIHNCMNISAAVKKLKTPDTLNFRE